MRPLFIAAAIALLVGSAAFASKGMAADKTTTPTAMQPVAPTPTMTRASLGIMIIHHQVADYAKWRVVFDRDQPSREAAGLTNCQVRQSFDDPNDVVVSCDMADLGTAKKFSASNIMKDAMKKAGVKGKPEKFYLTSPR